MLLDPVILNFANLSIWTSQDDITNIHHDLTALHGRVSQVAQGEILFVLNAGWVAGTLGVEIDGWQRYHREQEEN